ncbi:MAG TPA: right-handed parallel beta-helix repeat-containing protein [Planctomycetota bacterium]
MHRLSIALTSALAAAFSSTAAGQQIRYVDATATGANNGTSWADAFVDLQPALTTAPGNSELWVAAGTYYPATAGNQTVSFALRTGVALYGGFAGTETARWQRDVVANPTVLHGDLDGNDVQGSGLSWYQTANGYGTNSYQVVVANGVDATAVLDGFTITHGWAISPTGSPPQTSGGGLRVAGGSPRIANCTFRHCIGYWGGGAVAVYGGNPSFAACSFVENVVSDGRGGAVAVDGSAQATLRECTFRANTSRSGQQGVGGALYIATGSTALVESCRFAGNLSRNFYAAGQFYGAVGGAIYNGTAGSTIRNCTFVDNRANAGGGIFSYAALTVSGCVFNDNDVVAYNTSGSGSWGGIGGGLAAIGLVGTPAVPVENSTFVNGNASDDGGGAYFDHTTGPVTGCIFWNNTDSVGQVGRSQCRGAKPRYSCVMNLLIAAPGEDPIDPLDYPGSFDADPQFVDSNGPNNVLGDEDDDLRLLATSPCLDRADPVATSVGRDLAGVPRWLDGNLDGSLRIDCGAHEFTLVRLMVTVAPTSPTQAHVTFDFAGTAGLPALLALGVAGPGFVLPPFGGVFFDLTIPIVVIGLPPLPSSHAVTAARSGSDWTAQAVALAVGGATTSNPVTFRL